MRIPFVGNIFTRSTAPTDPKPPRPAIHSSNLEARNDAAPTPIKTTIAPAELPPGADAWIIKYTGQEYFPHGPVSDGRRWLAQPEKITVELARLILDEAGGIPSNIREQCPRLQAQWRFLDEEIVRHAWNGTTRIFLSQNEQIRSILEAGKSINPNSVQEKQDVYEQSLIVRKSCRDVQATLSNKLFLLFEPFCKRTRIAARKLVEQTVHLEREQAKKFGMDFNASRKLRALIFFGIAGWSVPIDNHVAGYAGVRPWPDWFGVQLWDAPEVSTSAIKTDDQMRLEDIMREHQELITSEKNRSIRKREERSADHEARVSELSAQNDQFREQLHNFRRQFETTGVSTFPVASTTTEHESDKSKSGK